MRRLSPALALLAVVAVAVAAHSQDAPPDPAVAAGQPTVRPPQAEIDGAVARGVKWLRKEQKRGGAFGASEGETALVLLTLRHSGVEATDSACKRAATYVERNLPDGTVYGAAIGALALIAQDPRLHRSKIERLLEELVEAQCTNGQWTYGYRSTAVKKRGDNSNSQFAILALASARAHGFTVPAEPFERSRRFLRGSQNDDGGFGYSDKERSRSYASMTAGATMCLAFAVAVARDEPAGRASHAEVREVRRTLEWLELDFDPGRNVGAAKAFGSKKKKRSDAFWRHYWLWSLERAASATGLETLDGRDWYGAGARLLLERQKKDGQWRDPERELVATCFALLFFRRSTLQAITPRDRVEPAITPGGGKRSE